MVEGPHFSSISRTQRPRAEASRKRSFSAFGPELTSGSASSPVLPQETTPQAALVAGANQQISDHATLHQHLRPEDHPILDERTHTSIVCVCVVSAAFCSKEVSREKESPIRGERIVAVDTAEWRVWLLLHAVEWSERSVV